MLYFILCFLFHFIALATLKPQAGIAAAPVGVQQPVSYCNPDLQVNIIASS